MCTTVEAIIDALETATLLQVILFCTPIETGVAAP